MKYTAQLIALLSVVSALPSPQDDASTDSYGPSQMTGFPKKTPGMKSKLKGSDDTTVEGCKPNTNCITISTGKNLGTLWGNQLPSDVIAKLSDIDGPCESTTNCLNNDHPLIVDTIIVEENEKKEWKNKTAQLQVDVIWDDFTNKKVRDQLITTMQAAFMTGLDRKDVQPTWLKERGGADPHPWYDDGPKVPQYYGGRYYKATMQVEDDDGNYGLEIEVKMIKPPPDDRNDPCKALAVAGAGVGGLAGIMATAFPAFAVIGAIFGLIGAICNIAADPK